MSAYTGLWVSFLLIFTVTRVQSDERQPMPSTTRGRTIEIPYDGPGQLLAIASQGPDHPSNHVLLLASQTGTIPLPFTEPFTARWRSTEEIIASRSGPGLAGDIVRMDRAGHIIAVLSEDGLANPRPSPDGRRMAVTRLENTPAKKGIVAIEIRDLDPAFETAARFSHRELDTLCGDVVWSPDGKRLAVDLVSNEAEGRVRARLGIVTLEDGSVRRLYDNAEDRQRDETGMIPLFWTAGGLYVRSQRGVLRCDSAGSGCTVVYDPGEAKAVLDGTPFGSDEALILVQDLRADPLEARAKELHRLNLTTGKGGLLYRFPDDIFVSAVDWSGR